MSGRQQKGTMQNVKKNNNNNGKNDEDEDIEINICFKMYDDIQ